MKIGIFDSGLGGLTVFKEILKAVHSDYIYLADNKNRPYGTKDREIVKEYILKNIQELINRKCNIIVIACNTATCIAINELRQIHKDICIIGTEPAVKRAVDEDEKNSDIIVCATSITIKEEKLNNLIDFLGAKQRVNLIALDKLVEFAENKQINFKEVEEYLKKELSVYDLTKVSHIVLGCTHFPIFKEQFENIATNNVHVIDGSAGIVNNLKNKIKELGFCNNAEKSSIHLVITEENNVFVDNFKRMIGKNEVRHEVLNIH